MKTKWSKATRTIEETSLSFYRNKEIEKLCAAKHLFRKAKWHSENVSTKNKPQKFKNGKKNKEEEAMISIQISITCSWGPNRMKEGGNMEEEDNK